MQKTAMANQGRRATLAELTEPLLANPVDSDDPYGKVDWYVNDWLIIQTSKAVI